jgi:MFS family permease
MQEVYKYSGPLLVLIGIMVTSNIYSLIPLYSSIASEMGIEKMDVALGSSLFSLFYAFGLLFFGFMSDYFGRKQIILFGLFISIFSTLLVGTANEPFFLYFFRAIQGFTLASFAPIAFSYAFEIFPNRTRAFWIALINAGFLAAGMVGQLISGLIVDVANWEFVYISFGVIYGCLFILGMSRLPPTKSVKQIEAPYLILKQMMRLFKFKSLNYCYVIVITILFSYIAFYEGVNYYLLGSNEILWVHSFGLLGTILCLFTGSFITKFSALKTLGGAIFLGWLSIFLLFFTDSLLEIGVLSLFLVASISVMIPTIIHLIGERSREQRGKALSLYSFILLIGASLGSWVASLFTFQIILIILFMIFTVNFLICLFGFREKNGL